ncbi:MAG: hypothetical protein AAB649_01120, partial [Patescibacteria group bacterium]
MHIFNHERFIAKIGTHKTADTVSTIKKKTAVYTVVRIHKKVGIIATLAVHTFIAQLRANNLETVVAIFRFFHALRIGDVFTVHGARRKIAVFRFPSVVRKWTVDVLTALQAGAWNFLQKIAELLEKRPGKIVILPKRKRVPIIRIPALKKINNKGRIGGI